MSEVSASSLAITVDGVDRALELLQHAFTSPDPRPLISTPRPTAWEFEAKQDHAASTLWDLATGTSSRSVTFLYRPYGNAVASVSQPHYSGTLVTDAPSGVFAGGQAGDDKSEPYTFQSSWRVVSWTKVTS